MLKKLLISQARITKLNERIYKINKTKKNKILKNKLHHMVHSYYSSKIPFRDSSLFMCTPGNRWSSGVLFGQPHISSTNIDDHRHPRNTIVFYLGSYYSVSTYVLTSSVFIWKMMNHLFSCQEKKLFPEEVVHMNIEHSLTMD